MVTSSTDMLFAISFGQLPAIHQDYIIIIIIIIIIINFERFKVDSNDKLKIFIGHFFACFANFDRPVSSPV
ncbi:hypothetical protein T4D_14687 [Trichinella pseudospiralis]|uniref:Uncharacterized protein n=1 Tax=Trichinella pseudospiralis TaxID=6337 RepID=A0A0V1FK31_TRIPS|nr:hypothetical protein T4D_14687 [Trichinella pseudospiralis]